MTQNPSEAHDASSAGRPIGGHIGQASSKRSLGKDLAELEGPAAIIDSAVTRKNCKQMLECAEKLGLDFRAHVKTHKTAELTRYQVGEAPAPVRLVVSTVAEALHLLPYLEECHKASREISILYGIPPSSTAFERLHSLRAVIGEKSVGFIVDDPAQLQNFGHVKRCDTDPTPVFLKIDTGSHRAGVPPDGTDALLTAISSTKDAQGNPLVRLAGLYSHLGSSYSNSAPEESMAGLKQEIELLNSAADYAGKLGFTHRLILTVGATPTVTSAQNLLGKGAAAFAALNASINAVKQKHDLEVHAGVYPVLDLQQIATHARPQVSNDVPTMSLSDISFFVLAEVLSVYKDRGKPEALIGAGSLALGREPCKSYPGWGVLAPRPWQKDDFPIFDEKSKTGWIVGRISQEHGILTWEGSQEKFRGLTVGEKVLIWPNHACIAGSHFKYYNVFDSSTKSTQIREVWERCSGW